MPCHRMYIQGAAGLFYVYVCITVYTRPYAAYTGISNPAAKKARKETPISSEYLLESRAIVLGIASL